MESHVSLGIEFIEQNADDWARMREINNAWMNWIEWKDCSENECRSSGWPLIFTCLKVSLRTAFYLKVSINILTAATKMSLYAKWHRSSNKVDRMFIYSSRHSSCIFYIQLKKQLKRECRNPHCNIYLICIICSNLFFFFWFNIYLSQKMSLPNQWMKFHSKCGEFGNEKCSLEW